MLTIPGQMHTESVPDVPKEIGERVRQYLNTRSAMMADWDPKGEGVLISTRFGDTFQLHQVKTPGGARKQLTFFQEPIYGARFCQSPDEHGFMFSMDVGGGEYYQIFYYDLLTGLKHCLTDGESKNTAPLWNHGGTEFVFSSTARNQRDHDVYLSDIHHPEGRKMVCKVQGYWLPLAWSPDNEQVLLLDYISATETYYHLLTLKTGEVTKLFADQKETVAHGDAVFHPEGKGLYFIADRGHEFMQLQYLDFETQHVTNLTPDLHWNITQLSLAPNGSKLAMVSNEGGLSKLYIVDPHTQNIQPIELPVGIISNPVFSPDSQHLAFGLNQPHSPGDVYSIDMQTQKITAWTESEVGGLNTSNFCSPELIHYDSFDGRETPAFYYKPKQQSDRPYPVVICIHGGPESQYRPGFSSLFQYWLNELDIAVLAPNVRGSSGYGKTCIKLDNGYLREDSVKDIGSLLDWIETCPELDEKRVCVYGGSYGGYMVLASMIHFNDRLRAGVDIVGISNFVTFLKNTKAYRRDLRRVEYGDERDPKMRDFLEAISPTTNAHKIKQPLLVAQGLNDPRVPTSEAEQIVKTVRDKGTECWYLLAKDEGHGFHKKANLEYYYAVVSLFLEKHLLD